MTDPHQPENLDRALSTYFRSQVPDPWPECRALEGGPKVVPTARPATTGNGGRAVLALSVAGLLGLGIFLSAGFPAAQPSGPAVPAGVLKNSQADGKNLLPPPKKAPMGDSEFPLN